MSRRAHPDVAPALTPKQLRFVAEYLKDLNASQAAIRAGYSQKNANVVGSRLLANVRIAAAVTMGRSAQAARLQVEADAAREQNAYIALADPIDLLDERGELRLLRDMPRRIRCAIRSIEIVRRNLTSGDGAMDVTHKVSFWDKPKALEMEYKHHGLLTERIEVSGEVTLADKIARARRRLAKA